ncbi:DUF2892 domain-containing protein [Sulfitobacter sp. SK012]|uniref:YgaP family membrane protein n=1 Tax=Sulfitobacter sp. SK012 TaxID=1389005 RepID=UPI000E0ADDED|nr:DUF2892 domain-containing protein [Sulfitobacter sp. SK012]AXI45247.1 DUF2892 domain-containing protein [Sulfitobacter sp. SK012]
MTQNLGRLDRGLRLLVGLFLIAAPFLNFPVTWASSVWTYAALIVGVILTATSLLKFCPIYRVLGLSTCKRS